MITLVSAAKIMVLFVLTLFLTYGTLVGVIITADAIKDRKFKITSVILLAAVLFISSDIIVVQTIVELLKNG